MSTFLEFYKSLAVFDYGYSSCLQDLYDKKGVSFSYEQNDSLKIINWFNADTNKNRINIENRFIIKPRSKIEDIVEVFGEGSWDYDSTYTDLIVEYEYFDIIVELISEDIPWLQKEYSYYDWDSNYKRFKNRKIKGIEVY